MKVHQVLNKCRYQNHGNTWGGYLQPMEIIALTEAGYKPCGGWRNDVKDAQEKKAKGKCNPTWFYFVRNKKKGVWQ